MIVIAMIALVGAIAYPQITDTLRKLRAPSAPLLATSTSCANATVNLCVTPDGTITNLTTPTAAFTIAYVREYNDAQGTPTARGVVRQIIIPRRKSVQVSPIQVSNDI